MNVRSIVTGAALVCSAAFAVPCFAQSLGSPYQPGYTRTTGRGEAVLQREIARIATTIRVIENDRRNDGGYRMRAVRDLERAQDELRRAIRWDNSHGGR